MTSKFKLGFMTHVSRPGTYRDPVRLCAELVELFTAAEALGFDGGWIAQHHGPSAMPSPLVVLSAIARATRRIELGTSVVTLPLEDPIRLAEDAAVLDALSGGRVQLGLGSGGANQTAFASFGVPFEQKNELFRSRQRDLQALLRAGAPGGVEPLRLEPAAPSLAGRIWHAHGTPEGAAYAAAEGNGLLLGTAVHDPERVQRPIAQSYLDHWNPARGASRVGVIRAVFPAADKAAARAALAPDLSPFGEWLQRDGLIDRPPTVDDILRLLNVHHGSADEIVDSLTRDPAVFAYADYFIPVVQSESSTLAEAVRRLEVIARDIAPRFGWNPRAGGPR